MQIETERMIIRKIRKSDALGMFYYARKPNVGPNAGWAPHRNIDETKLIIKMMIEENETFAITIKPFDVIVGTISFVTKKDDYFFSKTKELGYTLDDTYWNQGLMTEAATSVINYGFTNLGLNRIVCGHTAENKRSKRVIEKLGFKRYGSDIRKDYKGDEVEVFMYEIWKEDYFKGVM